MDTSNRRGRRQIVSYVRFVALWPAETATPEETDVMQHRIARISAGGSAASEWLHYPRFRKHSKLVAHPLGTPVQNAI